MSIKNNQLKLNNKKKKDSKCGAFFAFVCNTLSRFAGAVFNKARRTLNFALETKMRI